MNRIDKLSQDSVHMNETCRLKRSTSSHCRNKDFSSSLKYGYFNQNEITY